MNYITKIEEATCQNCIWCDLKRDGDQCRHATGLIYEKLSFCSHGRWLFDNGSTFLANDIPQDLLSVYQLVRLKARKEARQNGQSTDEG